MADEPKRDGRAPYWRRERYFDAKENRWRWRWRYTPTNAELLARREGLKHDARGFYRFVNGRRQYVTGKTDSGRRYHWDMRDGRRVRIWDDPLRWPNEVKKRRAQLMKQKAGIQSKLQSLRRQYAEARKDNHVLRRNINRRIRQLEADLERTRAALKRLPAGKPFLLNTTKPMPTYKGGILVTLDFALDVRDGSPLSFSQKLRVRRNAKIYVRATIHINDRDWRPGLLGAPEMFRVKWTYPRGWLVMDRLPRATDEYIVSNPLYLTRVFRAPGIGDTTPKFSCRVFVYEYLPTYSGAMAHVEERL